jgi:hypothetical protein
MASPATFLKVTPQSRAKFKTEFSTPPLANLENLGSQLSSQEVANRSVTTMKASSQLNDRTALKASGHPEDQHHVRFLTPP